MNVVVIGMGEIGHALHEVLSANKKLKIYTRDIDFVNIKGGAEVMHICYPYNKMFLPSVNDYAKAYRPNLAFIHSTVPVGTTETINNTLHKITICYHIVHAPIRGQHSHLAKGIKGYPMLIGADDSEALNIACEYMEKSKIHTRAVMPSKASELAKLISLTQYGVAIEAARYANKCCEKFSIPYDIITDYTKTYNDNITAVAGKDIGENHKKFNLDPPQGKIGGHCVISGMEKLNAQVPEEFISSILKVNRKLT